MTGETMVERAKAWFEWLPGWMPICAAIFAGAFWIGQDTQGINDRLTVLEKQVVQIQEYLRHQHAKPKDTSLDPNDDSTVEPH
jgi:hypothetical protein